jgi:hypothetical protein
MTGNARLIDGQNIKAFKLIILAPYDVFFCITSLIAIVYALVWITYARFWLTYEYVDEQGRGLPISVLTQTRKTLGRNGEIHPWHRLSQSQREGCILACETTEIIGRQPYEDLGIHSTFSTRIPGSLEPWFSDHLWSTKLDVSISKMGTTFSK